jgi:hypothetical protein
VARRALLGLVAGAALAAVPSVEAAYQPAFSLRMSDTRPASAPAVTATLTQAPGESASRRLAVRYPPQFGFNPGFAVRGCEPAEEQSDACPESSRIGSSRAVNVLGTFSGPVYLTADFRLLSYLRGLGGAVGERFEGKLYLGPDGSIEVVFDDLPNFPTTLAETTVEGGSRGLLLTPRQCGRHSVTGSFTSHEGEHVTSDVPIEVTGCPGRPVVLGLRARPRRFSAWVTLSWRLSEPALRTSVSVQRLERSHWRELRRLVGPGRRGANRMRVSGRNLRAGRYRFVLRAVGRSALVSPSRSVGATLVAPRRGREKTTRSSHTPFRSW